MENAVDLRDERVGEHERQISETLWREGPENNTLTRNDITLRVTFFLGVAIVDVDIVVSSVLLCPVVRWFEKNEEKGLNQ